MIKKAKYKGSIKRRLIAIILSVSIITALIGYGSFVSWYMQNQYERAMDISKTVGLVLGQDFAKLVLLNDVSAAADISTSLKSFSNLNYMVLYNLNEKPILQYNKEGKSFSVQELPKQNEREAIVDGKSLTLYIEANYQNTPLGIVQLKFEIESLYEVVERNIKMLILILGFMFVVCWYLTTYFAKKFTDPILDLVDFLEKVELTDSLNRRIETKEQNEYGKLYDEVNSMLKRLEASHEVMKIAAVAFETENGVTITDKNQTILQVNKAFTKITGYSPEEAIGQTPRILQSGLHSKEFYDEMKESLKEKKFWAGEINNRHKDGKIVNEHLTIHTVLDDKGETLYYVASFLDITLLKETEAKLKEKENLLIQKSKMAAMGEMIENIAHQWKQPLSMISTVATTLSFKKELDMPLEKKEELDELKKVNDTIQYLSHTIDDFRGFFKPDKEKTSFNVKECYKKVLNLIKPKLKSMDIEFVEDLDSVEVLTLQNELIQVIMNVLNNAKDSLQESDNEKKLIFVKIYRENLHAIISIKDNGGGISQSIVNRVFEPYFTTKEESDGTGIGLYMSKEMITKHIGGNIDVMNETFVHENEEYTGANFIISIPLGK